MYKNKRRKNPKKIKIKPNEEEKRACDKIKRKRENTDKEDFPNYLFLHFVKNNYY